MDEDELSQNEASAHADMNEDVPQVVPPADKVPPINHDEVKEKHKRDRMDKALDMLDEYYEGVPKPNPNFQHDDDHV
jgi:hypothetical protein